MVRDYMDHGMWILDLDAEEERIKYEEYEKTLPKEKEEPVFYEVNPNSEELPF